MNNRLLPCLLLAIIVNFLLAGTTNAAEKDGSAPPKVQVSEAISGLLIGRSLLLYEDASNKLDFKAVQELYQKGQFHPSSSSIPSYGITRSTIWASVILVNPSQEPRDIHIEHRYPSNSVALHRLNGDGSTYEETIGMKETAREQSVSYYFPAFRITLAPGENQLYFRFETWAPVILLLLWDTESFLEYKSLDYALNGAFFGAMILMIVYNLLIYITSRNRENIIYVFYLLAFLVLQSYLCGFGSLALGAHRDILADYWLANTVVGVIAAFEFSKSFLQFKDFRRLKRFLKILQLSLVFVGLLSLWNMYVASPLFAVLLSISFSLIIYVGIMRAREGYRPAYYFLAAWLCMSVCSFIILLTLVTALPFGSWSMRVGSLGVLLEMVLLSLAIGDKIKLEREHHIAHLSAQNQKIQHAFRQMKKVFYAHQVQLIEKGADLEKTMPTGPSEACVISFDIISSSKIQHEKSKDFFRNVFRRCNEVMMEGYAGEDLNANAYRIKEMGDGFLCSVGYPFQSATHHMAMDAIELAFRFHQIFEEEVAALDYPYPIHCGIGIALDNIFGFYPEVGTKEYDLYGRAIILATRYEGMRKVMFEGASSSSIMILQERVYLSLSGTKRKRFFEFDLKSKGIVVRDDPAAARMYYCFMGTTESRKSSTPLIQFQAK